MQALRQASRVAARQQFRRYAHNAVEEVAKEAEVAAKEANKWKMVTYAVIPMCIGLTVLTMSNAHTHHRNVPPYPYMDYRAKEFPWGPEPLFGMPK
ncbi:cytochrome c oxidase subunit mitochondrial [Micractinium conductrix]|uniref:Cytochrome c oxidase subunit mitochondrial n=1 Tax=Micractinium conductrix TaxID=554055 RepID=A0A2P6VRI2_9CHLO|nr:cytochrome c oxidase subunit mitochondrial [Micractinium conductrix]|eukprot:PSC76680.1 cytochrome c oxidase subunit mitochondrial [Micractinium conductrix]